MARAFTVRKVTSEYGLPLLGIMCEGINATTLAVAETQYTDANGDASFIALPDAGTVVHIKIYKAPFTVEWREDIFLEASPISADHGSLTGLGDDDHTQYVLESLYDADSVVTATTNDIPVVTTMAEQTVLGRLTGGHPDDVAIGIADNNILQVDQADLADNDFLKATASGVEGRSYSELRSDINVADGADVTGSNAPKAHTASHAVSGTDTIFPADPNADKYLMWDDDPGALVWGTPAGGGGDVATDAIWDAKGDLAVGTGANTASKLTVGANDLVLMAASGEATGLKWGSPAGGVSEATVIMWSIVFGG